MRRFEIGKTYRSEKTVIYDDNTSYTCIKVNKKSVIFHEDFYDEDIKLPLFEDGGQYALYNIGIITLEIRA